MARARNVPQGYAGFFNGGGGVLVAGAWRLHKTYKTYKTYKIMVGCATVYPVGLHAVVWYGSGRRVADGVCKAT